MVHNQNNSPLPVVPAGPTHRPRTTGHGQRSTGFSLIELLVAIGIIIILVGIAVVGVSSIVESAHQRQTRTMLEAAASLLNEYNVEMGTKAGVTQWFWDVPPSVTIPNVSTTDVSTYQLKFQTVPYRGTGALASSTDPPAPLPTPIPNYAANNGQYNIATWQMKNTGLLMGAIGRLPAAQKILSQLPDKSTTGLSGPPVTAVGLTDGWGHPLLFVPATGLGDGTDAGSVFSGAKVDSSNPSGNLIDGTKLPTIKSPDGKPFWASAGPDGDFRTGDDNLYSFGEQ